MWEQQSSPTMRAWLPGLGVLVILSNVGRCDATPTTVGPPPPTAERAKAGDGYRELEVAAEALRGSELYRQAEQPGATVAAKDTALADPVVRQALGRARRGIERGVVLPANEEPEAAFPRYGTLRSIARLLAMEQDARLRRGDAADAIETARLTMRLGQAALDGPLVSALTGLAIRRLPVTTFGAHLERLDAAEAASLLKACRDWLAEPEPFPKMLAAERAFSRRMARVQLQETRRLDASLDRLFAQLLAEWKKPAWERGSLTLPVDESAEGRLVAQMAEVLERTPDPFTRDQAQIRLLAVHAAIRRYQVEEGKLPESLEALKLGDLAVDPFTGKPFEYTLTQGRYRLTSAGPRAPADDERAVKGRRPISVVPEK